jgi:2-oxoglutarate ferredoxin oxidoreductase subunit alpha
MHYNAVCFLFFFIFTVFFVPLYIELLLLPVFIKLTMADTAKVTSLEKVVIRFSGDSGDGMQLTGSLFSNLSAIYGNEISTFPDFPAEIRAPQGTLSGVSGYQVHVGKGVYTPGDLADVLIAMNPAALKVNRKHVKPNVIIIVDEDTFDKNGLVKAGYKTEDPIKELGLESAQIIAAPITTMVKASLADSEMDNKSILKCKNMFALGLLCWLFNTPVDNAMHLLTNKFKKKPAILKANLKVMVDGFNYGSNTHASVSTYHIDATDKPKGTYTDIKGNQATAWGLIAASEKSGLPLFLGSYPITPATEIMQELALRKDLGVKTVQAEDEIAGICTAIGASFAGNLAATTTSGPGLALKSEAIGLAVMAELPLVIVDVQRGGPSTGLPTKTEQTDLLQALYGRNGESPCVVVAASTPANCFDYAFTAGKLAVEHMTPVILLTDTFLANGSSAWKIPSMKEYPAIVPPFVHADMQPYWKPYLRNPENGVRYWAAPGTEGFAHRVGGLEKDNTTSAISTDPKNHQLMTNLRQAKIANIANVIPEIEVQGNPEADLLVVGWGGTFGHLYSAVEAINAQGKKVALAHFNYINPLPRNTEDVLKKYKKIVVCELNSGQFAGYLRSKVAGINPTQYNKVEGQPFMVQELVDHFNTLLEA